MWNKKLAMIKPPLILVGALCWAAHSCLLADCDETPACGSDEVTLLWGQFHRSLWDDTLTGRLANEHFELLREIARIGGDDDREQVAMHLAGLNYSSTPGDLLLTLIGSDDIRVQAAAFHAVAIVALNMHRNDRSVVEIAEMIERALADANVFERAIGSMDASERKLRVAQARALNELYHFHPILSPLAFERWQTERYVRLVRELVLEGRESDDEWVQGQALYLLCGLAAPEAVSAMLDEIVEWIAASGSKDQVALLASLEGHPVLGLGRSMNLNLRVALAPQIDELMQELNKDEYSEVPGIWHALNLLKGMQDEMGDR